jgi:WXG100 family type VII secretion target
MTGDIIQANYEELERIAGRFDQWMVASEELHRRVLSCVQDLENGGWTGRAANAFFDEMHREIFPVLQGLTQALEAAHTVTLDAKNIMRAAEEEAANLFTDGGISILANGASEDDSWWDSWGEKIHTGLDIIGFIPGIGEVADGVNAVIYLAEGRKVEAAISAASMIPLVGDIGKGGKLVVKGTIAMGGAAIFGMVAKRSMKEGAGELAEEGVEATAKYLWGAAKSGHPPKASSIRSWAESQNWVPKQNPNGPLKYIDSNGVPRVTLKKGSPRTPGSGQPHVELKNEHGQRVDPLGNPVIRRSPENHTPIEWDLD